MYAINSLIHVGMFGAYAFTLYYSFFVLRIPMLEQAFKKFDVGQFKYLTMWGLITQAVFFLICIVNDMIGTNAINIKKPPLIRKIKDFLYATLGFPLAMFIGATFWGLMFVDRELVLPKALDPYFPWWLNHLLHTLIIFSTILEMILAPRKYPKRSRGLSTLVAFMLIYLIWVHIIYIKSGVWVYPIMDVLSLPLRILFFAVLLGFCVLVYIVGEALNNIIWGNEKTKRNSSHSKSQ